MIFRLLAASLHRRARQLALIALAVAVAAGTVAALTGFAARARGGLEGDLAAFGPNLVVRPQVGGPERLPATEVERVRRLPGALAVAGLVELPAAAALVASSAGPEVALVPSGNGDLRVVAADASLLEVYPGWRLTGHWPGAGEALLGERVAAEGGAVGRGRRLAVSGRLATGGPLDRAVFVSPEALGTTGVDRIEIRTARRRLAAVSAAVERTVAGAEARPLLKVSRSESSLAHRVALLLGAVSVVSLLLAFLSVGAATTALLDERREEVGLMMALGFTAGRVARFLGLELLSVAAFAALAGELAGEWAARELAGRILATAAGGVAALTWGGLLGAVSAAVVTVAAAMAVALRRVERLDAAQVLRGE